MQYAINSLHMTKRLTLQDSLLECISEGLEIVGAYDVCLQRLDALVVNWRLVELRTLLEEEVQEACGL